MCGITGFVDFNHKTKLATLDQMVKVLNHRGPDDQGSEVVESTYAFVGLGQSRLSIIDLSSGGHQPMHFQNLSIVYNGEIYNYREIRVTLLTLGHTFSTQSDTEVILHAYQEWQDECVDRFIGMFAFVIYDSEKNEIKCFRDRAGVKPFYYYFKNGLFLFSSELKSLHQHSGFEKEIDESALYMYFEQVHHGYIPAPHTIFKHTYKLLPGHILRLDIENQYLSSVEYWNVETFYKLPKLAIGYTDAKEQLKDLLISACNYRMVADVPVGVFLSGGYDSTLVTAILQKETTNKIKTFTIGFEEGNNEAPYAAATAKFLGTDHTEYVCTKQEAQDIIPGLPEFYDEPFADSSAIPTMLVSRIAREKVAVALSADAGDEIFAGYNSYFSLSTNLDRINQIPRLLKPVAGKLLSLLSQIIPNSTNGYKHKVQGIADSITSDNVLEGVQLFKNMNSLPQFYSSQLLKYSDIKYPTTYDQSFSGFHHSLEAVMAIDYQLYLQNDILTKVDRATMSVSLEGREPLLDHRIIEFAAQLPLEFKYDGFEGKRILKDITHEFIPRTMMDRPKAGFSIPIYVWLRNELSYLVELHLSKESLSKSMLFNVPFVLRQVELFKAGKLHYTPLIWKLLMFQMWYNRWM